MSPTQIELLNHLRHGTKKQRIEAHAALMREDSATLKRAQAQRNRWNLVDPETRQKWSDAATCARLEKHAARFGARGELA